MYCIYCGTKNIADAKFCQKCGRAMVAPPVPQPQPEEPVKAANPLYDPEDFEISNYPYPLPPTSGATNNTNPLSSPPALPPVTSYPPFDSRPQPPTVMPGPPSAYQPPIYPPFNSSPPANVYNQPGNGYPTGYSAVPSFAPPGLPHPVLMGATGLPYNLITEPQLYYSYLDEQGRVKVVRRAGFWKRFLATFIDTIIVSIPVLFLLVPYLLSLPPAELRSILNGDAASPAPAWINFVFYTLAFIYVFLFTALKGWTLGKRALKLKVIRLDGQKPDWGTSALRQLLGYTLSISVCGLGFLWVAWDRQKQAWHDKLARTLVVEDSALEEGRDFYLPGRGAPMSSPSSTPYRF
jgi:uncharacterized RDD family membrane protein YckC